jgi:hypothetical protein
MFLSLALVAGAGALAFGKAPCCCGEQCKCNPCKCKEKCDCGGKCPDGKCTDQCKRPVKK